jgi:Glycosyl transferase family 2
MKISIVVPSVFEDDAVHTLQNIEAMTRAVDYEVVVVSTFEMRGPRVKWVQETERRGYTAAQRLAFQHATGDLVVAFSDDQRFLKHWDEHLLRNFTDRERGQRLFCLGLRHDALHVGTTFGMYYPYIPVARRACFEAVDYFSADFQHHFVDPDLGLRIWEAGGRCEFSQRPLIRVAESDATRSGSSRKETSLDSDLRTYLGKWGDKFGRGWPTALVTDFNIDVDPLLQLVVASEFTVTFNHPLFKSLYDNYRQNVRTCTVNIAFHDLKDFDG